MHLSGLLQIQGLQLHGVCGPLFWLADCAAITRWFFRSCVSPVNQRTNPEQAQDPPEAKPQTPQPETKRQVLTGAQFTQHPPEANCAIFPPETPAVTIKAPLKFNCPSNESLGDENKPLLNKDIMPHILSAGSPDKESRCCDKLNETGLPNESPLAKTPRITHGLPPDDPRGKSDPL